MDEAPSAQTIEEPCTPPQRLSLHAIQLQVFAVDVTEMAKLGPECLSANQQQNPTPQTIFRRSRRIALYCPAKWEPVWFLVGENCLNAFCAKHIQERMLRKRAAVIGD
jgi:hypothetical protein